MKPKSPISVGQGAKWGAVFGALTYFLYQTSEVAYHPADFRFADMGKGDTFLIALILLLPFCALSGAVLGMVLTVVLKIVVDIRKSVQRRQDRKPD